jgi:hypothetical protein
MEGAQVKKCDSRRRGSVTHHVVNAPPDVLSVMADTVEHPILADKNDVLVYIATRQNSTPGAASMQQIHCLDHAQAARIIIDLECHIQGSQLRAIESSMQCCTRMVHLQQRVWLTMQQRTCSLSNFFSWCNECANSAERDGRSSIDTLDDIA